MQAFWEYFGSVDLVICTTYCYHATPPIPGILLVLTPEKMF